MSNINESFRWEAVSTGGAWLVCLVVLVCVTRRIPYTASENDAWDERSVAFSSKVRTRKNISSCRSSRRRQSADRWP